MTPHIEAKKEEIAKTVIMPGDPLRAKFIAENYLKNYKLVNNVRGMLAYTGEYNGKIVTVMASGMGMPSIGIYSYELFKFYDVDKIIRIGSAGSYVKDIDLKDLILVTKAYTESNFSKTQCNIENHLIEASPLLNDKIRNTAINNNIALKEGVIHCSEIFYKENNNYEELVKKYNCLGVEMESFALFHNAKILNKQAACLLTVSDSFITGLELSSIERQKNLTTMIELALNSIE